MGETNQMPRIVQCVPNFSEGRRPEVVAAIAHAMGSAGSAKVVNYSLDCDHNRCVITLVGEPASVADALLAGAKKAVELIDITRHTGGHPRIGAIDVVPVVPVMGVDMSDCVALSCTIGERLACELGLPVYFYEESANLSCRANLAEIRRGGYEALMATGLAGERAPDLGPSRLHPTAGATVVGARGPLIAYNVNLQTGDISVARSIAKRIRQLRDSGQGMAGVKAIGVELASRGIVQVSTNITQPHATGVFEVYKFIEDEAASLGIAVLESELIGVLREEAIVDAFCAAIKLPTLHESRVLDNWLPTRDK